MDFGSFTLKTIFRRHFLRFFYNLERDWIAMLAPMMGVVRDCYAVKTDRHVARQSNRATDTTP
ncbi:MAG: hypothetical protein AAF727_05215, partial [Pseudomonadota bacterium]